MLCASAIQAAFLWFSYFIQKLAEMSELWREYADPMDNTMLILMCLPENSRTELRTCGLYERDLQVFCVISWLCECKLHASWRTLFPEQKTVQELTVNFYKQTFYCWTILILFNVKKLGKLAYYLFPELLTSKNVAVTFLIHWERECGRFSLCFATSGILGAFSE